MLEEFCLVTGLRFGVENFADYDDVELAIPFRRRVFPSYLDGQHITGNIVFKIIDDELFDRLHDDDVISLCCLGWDNYPWGSYVWPTLYSQLKNANVRRWPKLYATQPTTEIDKKSYSIFGYTWAFKTWILESFRVTATRYYNRYNRYPRVAAWKKNGKFMGSMGNLPAARLTPDETEARSKTWISSRAYFDGRIGQAERVPRHVNRQNMYKVPSEFYRQFEGAGVLDQFGLRNPEQVRLTVLTKLQEALDEEAILEEQILALMHRFADRFTDRRVEINNLMVLHDHPLIDYEMVESFCNSYYIPDEVHPTAPGRDRTITQFPEGKVGVYTRLFDYCGYRIPLTKFFVAVLKYFRIHISQLSPFGAARISHFEVLTRVLDLGPSVAIFCAFYTRIYSDGLFSFAKRSLSAPSCLSKPPDSIKNWADYFFWVDSRVFHISVPLYTVGVLETARQEQAVQILSSNKAPFRRYPEYMGLLDYIKTADPQKVQAVEVQKGEEQVTLLDSIKHCFMSLDAPAAVQQASGSGSGADPEGDVAVVEKGDVAQKQSEKAKRKKLLKQSDTLPAKRLRIYHHSLASETDAPVYTAADTVTSSRGKTLVVPVSFMDIN
ncbi:hypothetical protein Tco_0378542 [Tanacetum coccineum]